MSEKKTVLHEVLAVEDTKRTTAKKITEEAIIQFKSHKDRFEGFVRTYKPYDDEGEKLPDERKALGYSVKEKLDFMFTSVIDYLDVSLTKESTNQIARDSIIVDGVEILSDVPVTGLLFLSKQVKALRSIFAIIPTLDPAETWKYDENQECYVSDPSNSFKTKKTLRNHVLSPATDKHPAQVQVYTEDENIGIWTKKRMSGAMSVKDKSELLARTDKLIQEIDKARMRANTSEITEKKIGQTIKNYLLG